MDTLEMVPSNAAIVTVDFNPVADAMRIMGSDGTNLRTKIAGGVVAEDGRHAFAGQDMHAGQTPMIVAGAYTESFAGAKQTALFTIDGTLQGLVRQDPPNDGTLKAVDKLGVDLAPTVGFDIASDGTGGNEAWLMIGSTLLTVDLATGTATTGAVVSGITGPVRDIAILPAM